MSDLKYDHNVVSECNSKKEDDKNRTQTVKK